MRISKTFTDESENTDIIKQAVEVTNQNTSLKVQFQIRHLNKEGLTSSKYSRKYIVKVMHWLDKFVKMYARLTDFLQYYLIQNIVK